MRAWILGLLMLAPTIVAAQTTGLPAELKGTWRLINDQGQPSYIAFADDQIAIYRGRLSTVTLNNSKHHQDAAAEAAEIETFLADSAANDRVSDQAAEIFVDRLDLPDLDDAARAAGTNEVSAAFRERLRDRLQRLLDRLQDAAAKGDGTLTRLDLTFATPADFSDEIDERRADIAVSGDRLYLMINTRIWIYDRTSALTGEAQAEWSRRGYRGFEYRLDGEYNRLFNRCVSLQRDDRPVEECRAYRDRMADFGVELRPEFVLERYRDFEKPSETEMAFWKNQLPASGSRSDTFPALDYCFDGHSTDETRETFTDRLAANRFRDTLWRLTTISNAPGEKPRNWTQDEYMAWAPPSDQEFGSRQGLAFLRADGVLGFGGGLGGLQFDPRDRWSYEDGEIRISWHDGAFEARIPIRRAGQMQGTTSFALAKDVYLDLVLGNYDLLTKMAYPQSHPDYEYLLPFAESSTCDTATLSTDIAEQQPSLQPASEESSSAPAASRPAVATVARAPEPAPVAAAPKPAPAAEPEPAAARKAELIGCWKWSNGPKISLLADGIAINGTARGRWRAVDAGYEIEWPPIEDALTMTGNGGRFDGVGLFGVKFSGTRIGAGDGLEGQWRRQDGVMLDFGGDGAATAGPLRGRWIERAPNSFTVSWPVMDSVSISADGSRLEIVNQFGKATARRDSGC